MASDVRATDERRMSATAHLVRRHFKLIDAHFETSRSVEQTVEHLRRTLHLSEADASAVYAGYLRRKRRRYRIYVGMLLTAGLVSLVGVNVLIPVTEDRFSFSPTALIFSFAPIVFFSPFTGWLAHRTWRIGERTAAGALWTFLLYSLLIQSSVLTTWVVIWLVFVAWRFE